jgi:hypothetical protein
MTMPFGRFKGFALTAIPKPYLTWLVRQPNIRPDLRAALSITLGSIPPPTTTVRDFKAAAAGDAEAGA